MNKKSDFTMNIGLPSIMLIFVVLCLVSFGILSLVSANSDKQLSQKILDRSTSYYNACNQAEEMLCKIDELLHIAYTNSASQDEYYKAIADISNVYTYKISDIQYLSITLSFKYPQKANTAFYQIESWQVITKDDLDYDTNLDLIEIY